MLQFTHTTPAHHPRDCLRHQANQSCSVHRPTAVLFPALSPGPTLHRCLSALFLSSAQSSTSQSAWVEQCFLFLVPSWLDTSTAPGPGKLSSFSPCPVSLALCIARDSLTCTSSFLRLYLLPALLLAFYLVSASQLLPHPSLLSRVVSKSLLSEDLT